MRHSCGAILYAYDPNDEIGIILGMEGTHWLPFKGGCDQGETFEDAAIREIYEETCKLVSLSHINLDHTFSTKHKHYHIGLQEVSYSILKNFPKMRKAETEKKYTEKERIRFFPISQLNNDKTIHSISHASIDFYWEKLTMLSSNKVLTHQSSERLRNQGYREQRVRRIFDNKPSSISNYSTRIFDKSRYKHLDT